MASKVQSEMKSAARRKIPEPVKFVHYLNAMIQGMQVKRSGKLTRLKLMAATTELLDERMFSDINVIDICETASVAKGTFYLQFETKEDIIHAVLADYVDFELQTMPVFTADAAPFVNTRALVGWYEMTFRVNAGLMRNFVRLSDSEPRIAALWKERNGRVVERAFTPYLVHSRFAAKDKSAKLALLALRSMGGIMDYAMFARHGIHQASDFTAGVSEEELIDLHALLMHRALYGEDPQDDLLGENTKTFVGKARPR